MILLLVITLLDDGSKLLCMERDSAYVHRESKALPDADKQRYYLVEAAKLIDNNRDSESNH
jgi:hypothetical protein